MIIPKNWLQLIGLVLSSALLFGCSNSSSSSTTKVATDFPFQAESLATTMDFDGDGNWDMKSTTSFAYNDAMQVVEQSTLNEMDENGDGVTDEKNIITFTFDPSITSVAITPKAAKRAAGPVPGLYEMGAITSEVYETYEFDADTNQLFTYPDYRRTYTYGYNADGNYTQRDTTRINDDNSDGTVDSTETTTRRYTYDENGNETRYEYTSINDNDGDGTADSIDTELELHEYDSHDNLTLYTYSAASDADGDGPGAPEPTAPSETTYTHTYTDNLLVKTVVDGDNSYTVDYSYDEQGRLSTKIQSEDQLDDDSIIDTFKTTTYNYDESGRITSENYLYERDNDGDEEINSFSIKLKEWTYNSDGLVSQYSIVESSDSTPTDTSTLDSNEKDTYIYEYEAGLLTASTYNEYRDIDLDGTFDFVYSTNQYTYSYDNGYLATRTVDYQYDWEGDIPPESADSEVTTYTYENGRLATQTNEDDDDGDGTIDSTTTSALTFNTAGQLTNYVIEMDNDNDGTIDDTQSIEFVYNADNSVSLTFVITSGEETTELTYLFDFGSSPIPSGNIDTILYSRTVEYPDIERDEMINAMSISSDADKTYIMKLPVPKILALLTYLQMDAGH